MLGLLLVGLVASSVARQKGTATINIPTIVLGLFVLQALSLRFLLDEGEDIIEAL